MVPLLGSRDLERIGWGERMSLSDRNNQVWGLTPIFLELLEVEIEISV